MVAPEFSVIVPTHGGKHVRSTVESVMRQTAESWELIIVDDASSDGTAELAAALAAADPRIRVVRHATNLGIARARNTGLQAIAASSAYVAFLDHDDLWLPDTLGKLRAALGERPAAVAAHGVATFIDEEGSPVTMFGSEWRPWSRFGIEAGRLVSWPAERATAFANFVYEDYVTSMGSGLIRRSALDRVGRFDPRAEPADDYDMWARLSRLGELAFLLDVVLQYRIHPRQTSRRSAARRGRGEPYVRYKLIASSDNSADQRRLAVAGFRAQQMRAARRHWSRFRAAAEGRRHRAALGFLVTAGINLVACARGKPWWWHA
jgi:glycosyltransferase involved in cell wall biosynthesis